MTSEHFLRDSGERPLLTVQSVPVGLNDWAQGSTSVASGSAVNFLITTYPDSERLSLWDQLFTIRVDVNDNDHNFPNGSALTNEQRNCLVSAWVDFADSSDTQNIRVTKVRVVNSGASTHTYYILFKAYTFASAGGTI